MLTQVLCPQCGVGNRVAPGHAPDAAKCGQCGSALFTGAPMDVDDAGLARHLSLTKGPVLVDIWAPWCGPCRAMAPHFAEAARRLAGQVVFLKMNADQCATPAKLGVRGIPALHLFADGKPRDQHSGMMSTDMLTQWLQSALATRTAS